MFKIMKSRKDFDNLHFKIIKNMSDRQRGNLIVNFKPSFFPCLIDGFVSYEDDIDRSNNHAIQPYVKYFTISRSKAKKLLYLKHLNATKVVRLGIIENKTAMNIFLTRSKYEVGHINQGDSIAKELRDQRFEKFERRVLGNLGFPLMVITSPVGSLYSAKSLIYMHPHFSFLTLSAAKEFVYIDKNIAKQQDRITAILKKDTGAIGGIKGYQQYVHSITGSMNRQIHFDATRAKKKPRTSYMVTPLGNPHY